MCSAHAVQQPQLGDLCTTTSGSRSTGVAAGCDAVGGACALAGSAKRTHRARRQRRKLCGCMVVEGRGTGGLCQRCACRGVRDALDAYEALRSEEHTSELQSLMRISYAVFCLKKKTTDND